MSLAIPFKTYLLSNARKNDLIVKSGNSLTLNSINSFQSPKPVHTTSVYLEMANLFPRTAPRAFYTACVAAWRPVQLQKPATNLLRRFLATRKAEQPRLCLGSTG
jgi:hypothetical protein